MAKQSGAPTGPHAGDLQGSGALTFDFSSQQTGFTKELEQFRGDAEELRRRGEAIVEAVKNLEADIDQFNQTRSALSEDMRVQAMEMEQAAAELNAELKGRKFAVSGRVYGAVAGHHDGGGRVRGNPFVMQPIDVEKLSVVVGGVEIIPQELSWYEVGNTGYAFAMQTLVHDGVWGPIGLTERLEGVEDITLSDVDEISLCDIAPKYASFDPIIFLEIADEDSQMIGINALMGARYEMGRGDEGARYVFARLSDIRLEPSTQSVLERANRIGVGGDAVVLHGGGGGVRSIRVGEGKNTRRTAEAIKLPPVEE